MNGFLISISKADLLIGQNHERPKINEDSCLINQEIYVNAKQRNKKGEKQIRHVKHG